MTTSQVLSQVRAKILEATEELVSDASLYLYANLTQQDIIKQAFPNDQILSATVTFTAGVGTLPTNFGTLYGDPKSGNFNVFPELSIDDFDKQTIGQAVTIEGGTIKVLPTTTASLTIKYYATYPDISVGVNPTINSYFHEPLVYGIIYRAFEDLQDPENSTFYSTKYENLLNQRIANQSNYEEGNQRSGQLFVHQDLIGGLSSDSPNFF